MSVSLYVTTADEKEARRLARMVVDEKLAACANLWPISSVYKWKGELCDDSEFALLFKTRQELIEPLMRFLAAAHSYECPCMVALEWKEAYGPYALWVEKETRR